MSEAIESKEEKGSKGTQVFLESDDEIRGQKFVCISFLSPEKALMRSKNAYFVSKFLEFVTLDHKIRATESFVLGQFREVQNRLSEIELALANGTDLSGNPLSDTKKMCSQLQALRESMSKKTATDMEEHVKANMSDFRETKVLETYERFMMVNRQRLEDEFHKSVGYRTSVHGLKVRGVYATNEQAKARAQALHKKDPYFNVYVGDVGEWLPWDPEPEEVPEQEYSNDSLNKLMQSYRDNSAKKDAFFEEEKRQRIADAGAAAAAVKEKRKAAVFGESGKTMEAAEVAREIFDGPADLAMARKQEQSQSDAIIHS
jgi:hypothetical protein